ncbi:MAG: polyprenyl synthetase family protein [Chlamydiales bacterium]|nr:polyprenyl synthetase family protein [Chlamydiales bacterium]
MKLAQSQQDLLRKLQTCVDAKVESYLAGLGDTTDLGKATAHALVGGKRFRPALVLLIADALGRGADPTPAALAIEFFHTASLVADDLPCMDNDDERRGKPSVHVLYGEAVALLVTYALIAEGYRCLTQRGPLVSDRACLVAIENVTRNTGLQGATGGQFIDLFPPDVSPQTLQEVIHKKTVSLFEIAFVLGWIYGGGDVDSLEKVQQAAWHYGMAFQIADDFEDEAQDAAHGCQVNLALSLGREVAHTRFMEEIEAFRKTLQDLAIASEPMLALADSLVHKVDALTNE